MAVVTPMLSRQSTLLELASPSSEQLDGHENARETISWRGRSRCAGTRGSVAAAIVSEGRIELPRFPFQKGRHPPRSPLELK